jgi:hypothetical protein
MQSEEITPPGRAGVLSDSLHTNSARYLSVTRLLVMEGLRGLAARISTTSRKSN